MNRLLFIRHARDLGFGVENIRSLLALVAEPDQSCAAVDAIARQHLAAINEKIAKLTALKSEVTPKTRADHSLKCLHFGLTHFVASGEVMRGKQEHLLNACFLLRLQEALCATLWWTE